MTNKEMIVTDNEMVDAADLLVTLEDECQEMQKKIDGLREVQRRSRSDYDNQKKMLLDCVGASIQERIIPVGDKAVIITYNPAGNKLRISNRVVVRD